MIQTLKKQGLRVALPLLLLTTACGGEKSTTAFQPGAGIQSSDAAETVAPASTEAFAGLSADATLGELGDIVPTTESDENIADAILVPDFDEVSTSVPEPTALAGLAVAALGLGAIKRRQSA
ncbi:MAG: PEP-CTERM sorting domain-containing protein [Phormidesmis sp.]